MHHVLVVAVFCLTYALISARRLRVLPIGRPAGALLGAVLMVAIGAVTPRQSFEAVDQATIVLLFGTMLITAYLDMSGFFGVLVMAMLSVARTPWALLVLVAVVSAVLSAFLVNDTVCLFMTPVVVALCRRAQLPMGPYLIAVATSANIGSAATLVGNPQNMIIANLSQYGFREFLGRAGPAALVGLGVNVALLWLYYGRTLPAALPPQALEPPPEPVATPRELRLPALVTLAVVIGFFAGLDLGYTTLAGAVVLIVGQRVEPRDAFARVDWPLLVFFCSLFVVVDALDRTGLTQQVWTAAAPHLGFSSAPGLALFTALMVVGSNVVSNVPMVMLTGRHLGELGSPELGWVLLAFTTTVAGNFTLIGSVANIIVAECSRAHYTLGFVEYLRFGLVSTLLVLATGVPVICWLVPA